MDKDWAESAARTWFHETRSQIEVNRGRTGDSFADGAIVSLELAIQKLATIIRAAAPSASNERLQEIRARLEATKEATDGPWGKASLDLVTHAPL